MSCEFLAHALSQTVKLASLFCNLVCHLSIVSHHWSLLLSSSTSSLAPARPGYLWTKIDSEEYLAFQTIVIVAFGLAGPVNAQFNLPVKLPDHYMPFVGFSALMAAHVYALATAGGKSKKS